MPHNQYIHQRRQGWYVRVVVPPRLRPIVGKAHVVKSLRTRDVELARVRRWGVLAAVTEWFAEVSAAGFTPLPAHAVSPTTTALSIGMEPGPRIGMQKGPLCGVG